MKSSIEELAKSAWIRSSAVIESLRRVMLVALDKTGTLTEGKPVVTDVIGLGRAVGQILMRLLVWKGGIGSPTG